MSFAEKLPGSLSLSQGSFSGQSIRKWNYPEGGIKDREVKGLNLQTKNLLWFSQSHLWKFDDDSPLDVH